MIAAAHLPHDDCVTDVELVAIFDELDIGEPKCFIVVDSKREYQPIRQVHEVLVQDRATSENRRFTVVDAVDVRPRVVHSVRAFPFRGSTRAQVAVSGRSQRFTQPLLVWVESVVRHRIAVHRAGLWVFRHRYLPRCTRPSFSPTVGATRRGGRAPEPLRTARLRKVDPARGEGPHASPFAAAGSSKPTVAPGPSLFRANAAPP